MNRLFLLASLVFLFSCQETKKKYGINSNENPFFQEWNTPFEVPPFKYIKDEHYMPAFEKGIHSLPFLQDHQCKFLQFLVQQN